MGFSGETAWTRKSEMFSLTLAPGAFTVLAIFVTLFNYIVDTYLWAAASALAANSASVCRSSSKSHLTKKTFSTSSCPVSSRDHSSWPLLISSAAAYVPLAVLLSCSGVPIAFRRSVCTVYTLLKPFADFRSP